MSLIGRSAYMNSLRREILSAGEVDSDVLICGETGTGKELVATAIYQHSARRSRPLVSVNMSAIPSALAPAALFGNAKGAYTGAERAGVGYFQRAEGGVLFLDEIGDTASDVQPQLLRAIQQREIQSIGGPVREIDLRIIAATDSNLEDPGEFKAALRHRLGSIQFLLKPLRSHSQDIGELLWDFMGTAFDSKSAALSLPGADSSSRDIANWAELFYLFLSYSWPGNVRQLANFANQVAIASDTSLTLPAQLRQELTSSCTQDEAISTERRSSRSVSHTEFCLAMEQANYEPAGVARVLRISRTAVYRRIEVSSEFCLAADIPRETLCSALEHASGDLLEAALDLRVSVVSLRSRASGLGLAVRY